MTVTATPPAPAPRRRFGPVFWASVGIAGAFVAIGVLATGAFNRALGSVVDVVIDDFGWLYLLLAAFFLVYVVGLAVSRFGAIRLGGPDARPEFGRFSWFAMLFQAGMGIGLLFWAVSEPVLHYHEPPPGEAAARTPEAATTAIRYSFFHWSLHPWAIYAVVGLAVAYFGFRRDSEDLRISGVLRPLLGDRVDGPVGRAIDVLAVIATLFGVAVSLGLGTLQINAGLAEVFGLPSGIGAQLGIIAVTAVAYLVSAMTPIRRGIRGLSNLSIVLAVLLLGWFAVVGPTVLQLNVLTEGVGDYLWTVLPMSVRTSAFDPDPWLGEWTVFFWATWVAWAPYVGAFVARISRGRTIREFVAGVLVAPTIFSVVWFSVFGAAGIDVDRETGGAVGDAAAADAASGMFEFLQHFPLFVPVAALTIFLVWIFFVAGADAGTVVLGSMSSDGEVDAGRRTKLTWGVIMAVIAATLLAAGGLDALQDGAIVAATPFAIVMVLICWSLLKALLADHPPR